MKPIVLGIETSCDDTCISFIKGDKILSNIVSSSCLKYKPFGGIVPSIAAKEHLNNIFSVLSRAIKSIKDFNLFDIDAISVTSGPGLSGSLMIGVNFAKALSIILNKPIYAVNHLVSHISAAFIEKKDLLLKNEKYLKETKYNNGALIVSGGHTEIAVFNELTNEIVSLGHTVDDAAGEVYDKIARTLGIEYPGALELEKCASKGNYEKVQFPRCLMSHNHIKNGSDQRYNFSFSGLKTAVIQYIRSININKFNKEKNDIAASFQEAIIDVLVKKVEFMCVDYNIKTFVLCGGVASNNKLRISMTKMLKKLKIKILIPPKNLCKDNGAMVALLGSIAVCKNIKPSNIDFSIHPSQKIEKIFA